MADAIHNGDAPDEMGAGKSGTQDAAFLARRRAVKVGLTAAPVILTLRNKPLFAADCSAATAMSMTHASHAIEQCTPGGANVASP